MEDVPKLLTLLLLDVFFVPTRLTSLNKAYIDYVDDLSKIKTFDWSGHIFEKLISSIYKHKSKNPRKVTGCVMALPYWLMENFNIGKPKNPDARPLCQKWNLQDLTYSTKKMTISKVCQDKRKYVEEMMEGSSNCAREEDEKKIVYDYPLFCCANSIQQESNSLDCGVIVCYLMEAIASGRILKPSLSMEELASYKAGFVSTLFKEYK